MIENYKIVCDESNNPPDIVDQNQLRVDIHLNIQYKLKFRVVNDEIIYD
jgi:hypothetical protein